MVASSSDRPTPDELAAFGSLMPDAWRNSPTQVPALEFARFLLKRAPAELETYVRVQRAASAESSRCFVEDHDTLRYTLEAAQRRINVARIVAGSWIASTLTRNTYLDSIAVTHIVGCVGAALNGTTDPTELGIGDDERACLLIGQLTEDSTEEPCCSAGPAGHTVREHHDASACYTEGCTIDPDPSHVVPHPEDAVDAGVYLSSVAAREAYDTLRLAYADRDAQPLALVELRDALFPDASPPPASGLTPELAAQAAAAIRRAYGGIGSTAPDELPQWAALYALDEIARVR